MRARWSILGLLVLLGLLGPLRADEPSKAAKSFQVPYRLTDMQHVLVRAKINGKGPFNFIIDTGAPLLFVSTGVGKKLGLEPVKGWTTLDRFEMEGGVVQTKVKCRVETPFQLDGMNAMGLAGVELHGIIGYTVLAHYRMEFDFTRDKMTWTKLAFVPPAPQGIGSRGGAQAGLEMIGTFMKFLGFLSGAKAAPDLEPRGFLGLTLAETDGAVTVTAVLAKGPAAAAGLLPGDSLEQVQGKGVRTRADVHRLTAQVTSGQSVRLLVIRDGQKRDITITAGEGL